MDELNAVCGHIETKFEEHLIKLQSFLRQPAISAENVGIRETAELLLRRFKDVGSRDARLVEGYGYPIVFGDCDFNARKTLLIYLRYDVQPPGKEAEWSSPPFDAQVKYVEGLGRCVIARGARDHNGPMMAFFNAIESIIEITGMLPVNLIMIAEGEEEIGSPHLKDFLRDRNDALRKADAAFFPSALQDRRGICAIHLGGRGLAYFETECDGAKWKRGPTKFDVHSAQRGLTDSPTVRLVKALASFFSDDGNKVMIDGFYESARDPNEEDLEIMGDMAGTYDLEAWKEQFQVQEIADNKSNKMEIIKQLLFRPTLNIDGLVAGHTSEGSKTIIPRKAVAKLDARLVPDQSPQEILLKVRRHLDTAGYGDIEVREVSSFDWSKTSPKSSIARACTAAYDFLNLRTQVWPFATGSAPYSLFTRGPLHVPFCLAGAGHGGRQHSTDEYLVVEGIGDIQGLSGLEKSYALILHNFAKPD